MPASCHRVSAASHSVAQAGLHLAATSLHVCTRNTGFEISHHGSAGPLPSIVLDGLSGRCRDDGWIPQRSPVRAQRDHGEVSQDSSVVLGPWSERRTQLICRREELRSRCQAKRPCCLFSDASSAWPWEQAAAHVVGSWHSGRGSLFCTCTLERRSRFSTSADIGYLSSNRASALTANADPGLRDARPVGCFGAY